jgi:hypothetical protein
VYNDQPWDPKIVAVVDWWSLIRGHLFIKSLNWDFKMMVVRESDLQKILELLVPLRGIKTTVDARSMQSAGAAPSL